MQNKCKILEKKIEKYGNCRKKALNCNILRVRINEPPDELDCLAVVLSTVKTAQKYRKNGPV